MCIKTAVWERLQILRNLGDANVVTDEKIIIFFKTPSRVIEGNSTLSPPPFLIIRC